MDCILSIDQSTSATKGLVWSSQGKLLSRVDIPHAQITNEQGWIEHNPEEIYSNVLRAARSAIEKAEISPACIRTVGISNQRETAVCWDAESGRPVYHAIVWQCGRAAEITSELDHNGFPEVVRQKTGLNLSPYFSASKFAWILRHSEEAQSALQRSALRCGTIDAWLLYKLTGEFRTEYSNACRTQLLNLDSLTWDDELIAAFGLTRECLPEICMSDALFGSSDFEGLFTKPVPIQAVMGDSHAALFGNRCFSPGSAKVTYGTGSSIMMNVGAKRPNPCDGIATSLAWGMNGQVCYALEGNINYSGAVIKWLVEDLELIDSSKEAGRIAAMAESTNGVYLVPAFSGLGAPYYNNQLRAAFFGMNRTTKKAHLIRAAEECIAYQITDVVEAIKKGNHAQIAFLCADGGATKDSFLMQFQADMLGTPLHISRTEELSGGGVAYCAALRAGLTSVGEDTWKIEYTQILPKMDRQQCMALYTGWKNTVKSLAGAD